MSHDKISHPYLSKLRRGIIPKTVESSLAEAISLAIDMPVDQVLAAAGQPMTPGPFRLPKRADRLTSKERDLVISMVDVLLSSRGIKTPTTMSRNGH